MVAYLSGFAQIYKFKSSETDVEKPGQEDYTKYEVLYHTFNLDNNTVTFEGKTSDGSNTKVIYKVQRWYEEGLTTVGVVNEKGVKEVWYSAVANNLGYDLIDGTRLACYKISRIN